jgi:hypothetical protein
LGQIPDRFAPPSTNVGFRSGVVYLAWVTALLICIPCAGGTRGSSEPTPTDGCYIGEPRRDAPGIEAQRSPVTTTNAMRTRTRMVVPSHITPT